VSPEARLECGKDGWCSEPSRWADLDETHAVRCCHDVQGSPAWAWKQQDTCSVWATSRPDGSCRSESFAGAAALCAAAGARLCAAAELLAGCTQATGCGYDEALVWSSDARGTQAGTPLPPPPPAAAAAPPPPCLSHCQSNTKAWADKCNWAGCGGCSSCPD